MNNVIPELNKFQFNLFPYIFEIKNFLNTVKDVNSAYLYGSLAHHNFEYGIMDIDLIVLYNKISYQYSCFVRTQIENILAKFLPNFHLNIIQLCVSQVPKDADVTYIENKISSNFNCKNGYDIRKRMGHTN